MKHGRDSALQREIRQTRPFRTRAQEAAVSILRTADHVRNLITTVMQPWGMTMQQYNVLRILRGTHPQPLPTLEIGERLIERTPGITRLLDKLEEKELVRRERSADDRRLVHCWITAAGLELLASMDEEVDRVDDDAVAALTAAEIETLIDLLARVRQAR